MNNTSIITPLISGLWGGCEVLFYMYIHCIFIPKIQPIKEGHRFVFEKPEIIVEKILRIIGSLKKYTFDDFISGWFLTKSGNKSSPGTVLSINMNKWLAWLIFTTEFTNLNETQIETINATINNCGGIRMEEGFNSSIYPVSFSLDQITHIHKPLCVYGLLRLRSFYGDFKFYCKGFNYYKTEQDGMSYWYRKCPEPDSRLFPLIIFHGIYCTWYSYLSLIDILRDKRDIILINYDGVKIGSLSTNVVGPFTLSKHVINILDKHNITKFSLFGHSWGTILAGWILKTIPERIHHITLIDPVAITIFLPPSAYTILYKPPQTCIDYLITYLIRNDLTISYNLRRHFEWYNTVVFLDEIPDNIGMVIGLSLCDELIHGEATLEIVDAFIETRNNIPESASVRKLVWDTYIHNQSKCCSKSVIQIAETVFENEINGNIVKNNMDTI
jgi:pimeloyl-ACP methyl ester carboxylesterase